MDKVLVLGVNGMLGHTVFEYLQKNKYNVYGTSKPFSVNSLSAKLPFIELDAQYFNEKDLFFNDFNFIINCIGIIKPRIDESSLDSRLRAIEVNSLFPHKLAKINPQSRIIQIATDCVYSGEKGNYTENDPHDALDLYGKTKSLGEVISSNVLNLRCSIIGREIQNFVSLWEWLLSQNVNSQVNGFKNHNWNGVTTLSFAKVVAGLIKNNIFFNGSQHLSPLEPITKFELLNLISEAENRKDLRIIPSKSEVTVNRTLSTLSPEKNLALWQSAGYDSIPTIKDLIFEASEEN